MNWTEPQREACENLSQGLSVLAAAGSGKTRVLVERYAGWVRSGVEPGKILTVTFTREAAEQLRSRIVHLFANDSVTAENVRKTSSIGTIHSFCLSLLKSYGGEIQSPREILDDVRWHECFDAVFEKWFAQLDSETLKSGLELWNPLDMEVLCKEALRQSLFLRPLFSQPRTEGRAEAWWLTTLPSLFSLWQQQVVDQGIYSFTDLEEKALELLELPKVREQAASAYSAFLIDEFQDTSPAQWKILEQVVGNQWDRVFIVGDPRQSIYGFRNADADLFFGVLDRICSLGGKKIELSTCFRSTPEVVRAVNEVSARLFAGNRQYEPLLPGRESVPGVEGLSHLPYTSPETKSADLSRAEVTAVTTYLKKRIEAGYLPSDFALLFRSSERITDFAAALDEAGIAARYRKGERLFDHYFTWDVLGFYRLILDPGSEFAASAFLLSPFIGLQATEIQALQAGRGLSLLEKLSTRKDARTDWLTKFFQDPPTHPVLALQQLLAQARYWPQRYPCWDSLTKLLSESSDIASAVKKLELCARGEVLGTSAGEGNPQPSVSLLTIHAAKGLEYREVLLVDLLRRPTTHYPWVVIEPPRGFGVRYRDSGALESSDAYKAIHARKTLKEKEEEMRLMYVALTRAKDRIVLSLPENRALIKGECWASYLVGKNESGPK